MCALLSFLNEPFWASVAGGLVGGLFTYLGVKISVLHDRKKTDESDKAEVRAFCKAIETELLGIKDSYLNSVGGLLGVHKGGTPFLQYYPVYEQYFTVFNSSAHVLGKIPDDNLRSQIVTVYNKAKGHLDSLRHNNYLSLNFQDFFSKALQTNSTYDQQQRDLYHHQLSQYSTALIRNHAELVNLFEDVARLLKAATS